MIPRAFSNRARSLAMWLVSLGTVGIVIAACAGTNKIDVGEGDDDTSTPPTLATFTTNIQPWFARQSPAPANTCGAANCHGLESDDVDDIPGRFPLKLIPGPVTDSAANYAATKCRRRAGNDYDDPTPSTLFTYFCFTTNQVAPSIHQQQNVTPADCLNLAQWLREGSGRPPKCP